MGALARLLMRKGLETAEKDVATSVQNGWIAPDMIFSKNTMDAVIQIGGKAIDLLHHVF